MDKGDEAGTVEALVALTDGSDNLTGWEGWECGSRISFIFDRVSAVS